MVEKMDGKTMNITEENLNKLKDLFPEVFEEGKINFDKLQVVLGENIDKSNEKYEFSWNGKFEAMKLAQLQSTGTLIPCKEKSKDWDTTQNLYIEGDNLEVLKLLQKSYVNQIKMIYIDPPYNTGNDFVYEDNFADNIANYKAITGQTTKSNAETSGRYHTNWLNMMYPRLKLARNLLKPSGIIAISIDDHEIANLRKICDEIFGENNFIGEVIRKTKSMTGDNGNGFNLQHESLIIYGKDSPQVMLIGEEKDFSSYSNPDNDPNGDWCSADPSAKSGSNSTYFEIKNPFTGKVDLPPLGRYWAFSKETLDSYIKQGRIKFKQSHKDNERGFIFKRYKNNIESLNNPLNSLFAIDNCYMNQVATTELNDLMGDSVFSYPKPVSFIKKLVKASCKDDDIVLDFFSGSGTTAQAVMELNKENQSKLRFIMVQLPEKIENTDNTLCDIGEERLRKSIIKIDNENPIGFKVFKLDTSNLVKWNNTPTEDVEELKKRLQQNLFYIVDGRSNMDLVYEIMLKYGLPLTLPINEKKYGDYKAYEIASDTYKVMICLDRNLPIEIIEQMTDEAVGTYVFADHCFGDANILINTEEILKKKSKNLRIF